MSAQLSVLRNKIRFGLEPDNPALIALWLANECDVNSTNKDYRELSKMYEQQFRLLLETIIDELVPAYWRRTCLDYIYRPLSSLQRIAITDEGQALVRKLNYELTVSCQYIEGGLHYENY
tara:strand:- start:6 stop:365 length:360 start_codon:yes stop_codon:yes gene_type:complete